MRVERIMHEKLETQLEIRKRIPSEMRLYAETVVYSIIVFIVIFAYSWVVSPEVTVRSTNRVVADLAFILMGLSMMLSSLCYFWNFADRYIIYRKHLGLVGVGYMAIHGAISLLYSGYLPFQEFYLSEARLLPLTAAVIATLIFAVMALVSNRLSIQTIGPKRWKLLMRIGFLGYFLALIHFAITGIPKWLFWFTGTTATMPPFALVVFLFGSSVLALRTALWIATSHRE